MLRNWEVTISYTYKEGNQVADYLADIGHGLPPGTHSISTPGCNFGYYLHHDCMDISELRNISS
ncbi:hypothetical protein LINPERHAP2_LOCUS26565 [Linum perenne]